MVDSALAAKFKLQQLTQLEIIAIAENLNINTEGHTRETLEHSILVITEILKIKGRIMKSKDNNSTKKKLSKIEIAIEEFAAKGINLTLLQARTEQGEKKMIANFAIAKTNFVHGIIINEPDNVNLLPLLSCEVDQGIIATIEQLAKQIKVLKKIHNLIVNPLKLI